VAERAGLQIDQDLEFQRREWRLQHVAWWGLTAFVVAGLAGLFGVGPRGSVFRAAAVYAFLLLLFRVTGKRSLAQITVFDFVLLLIIGEATQQALLGNDSSMITAFVVIGTLMLLELGLTLVKGWVPKLDPLLDSTPLVIIENGKLLDDRMGKERVDVNDILAAARERHGLERLDQIKFAVLERNGGISIIPREK
jgi:uncharacterized membrane protein YcaP (DUF421 family)